LRWAGATSPSPTGAYRYMRVHAHNGQAVHRGECHRPLPLLASGTGTAQVRVSKGGGQAVRVGAAPAAGARWNEEGGVKVGGSERFGMPPQHRTTTLPPHRTTTCSCGSRWNHFPPAPCPCCVTSYRPSALPTASLATTPPPHLHHRSTSGPSTPPLLSITTTLAHTRGWIAFTCGLQMLLLLLGPDPLPQWICVLLGAWAQRGQGSRARSCAQLDGPAL